MAIVRFRSKQEEVPADATAVQFVERSDYPKGGLWLYHTHAGLCLQERESNGRDDSDFFMLVWDEAAGRPVEVLFATTRGWSYPSMASFVDATPEVQAKWQAWQAQRDAEAREARLAAEAARPARGKRVRVLRHARGKQGRPVGTEGLVFWQDGERLGVDANGDRFFINSKDVAVVQQ